MIPGALKRREFLGASLGLSLGGAVGACGGTALPRASSPAGPGSPNEKIQHARDVALGILKPGAKELEHGLRLHAESVVFDAYGFAPRAALDGDAMRRAVEAGASAAELLAAEEEMSMTRCVTSPEEGEEFREAWKASGVTCIFQNAGEEGQNPLRLIKRLAAFTYVTDMMRPFVAKAATPEDVEAARKENRHCLYFTGNGVPLGQDWVSVQEELRYVRVFFQLGIRMMHLTYNRRNMIGDGCAEAANAGLSDFGRAAVAEMNRVGSIPDVAHSGWKTSLEAAKVSKRPVVASHSSCAAVHTHIRGKPDEVLRALADSGGYIGICCIPRFLGGAGDIRAMLDHIDYAVKRFGADHVAIGTDVAYSSRNTERERKKIPPRSPSRTRFEALWPPDPHAASPGAQESMAWTNWPLFTVGLVQRGYRDEDIRKIIGGNVLRVAREALKG